jgi:carboxypeptidase PM20D1
MKKRYLVLLFLPAIGVPLGRALLLKPRQVSIQAAPALKVDDKRICKRLGRALQFPTVSFSEDQEDATSKGRMAQMVTYLEETFAPVIRLVQVEKHPYNLVLRLPGTDESLAPLLLLAHLDVVPVEPKSADQWNFPPFSGSVAAGSIWGRGALDNKSAAMAMLEAAELLISANERPRRGVVFSFGYDEEIGGERGARAQAERFAEEGLAPHLILDEGFVVLDGVIDAVQPMVAGIGIAEKGYLTLRLEVQQGGGHASMPGKNSAIGILAAAITSLESNPMEAHIDGAVGLFFDELAREMEFGPKLLFANRWLTEGLLIRELEKQPSTAATLRTTTAVTTTTGGVAENALPESASATINFRIHPRDSIASVLEHVSETVGDDRVRVDIQGTPSEPSGTSPANGAAYALLEQTIRECFEGVIVAPSLVLAATDSRHYAGLSPNVYRFNPIRLQSKDLDRIHGINERIPAKDYLAMIRFYRQLLSNS